MNTKRKRKIVFLTGTRADFGKLKSLLVTLCKDDEFEIHIFVTGMHMLQKYGYTCAEIEKCGFTNLYRYINQNDSDSMDAILAKTVAGFSDYVKEVGSDMVVVHGDRVEALAGAVVGSFNNILVSHIEGGEVSGTIDELIRHSVSKLSHLHFVANEQSRNRLIQLGEEKESVFVIGSPDFDVMASDSLPDIEEVKKYYEIDFEEYGVLIFHPVTTELERLSRDTKELLTAVSKSELNYVVIYPNNDPGNEEIFAQYQGLAGNEKFRIIPSMRFEYFLVLMKHSQLVIGNSSAGVREAPYYSVPSVDIGSRQNRRGISSSIINCESNKDSISKAICEALSIECTMQNDFGQGNSAEMFYSLLKGGEVWDVSKQKYFRDIDIG